MCPVKVGFAIFHQDIGILQLHFASTETFYFPTLQYQAGFLCLLYMIIEACFFVLRDRARAGFAAFFGVHAVGRDLFMIGIIPISETSMALST